MFLKQVVVLLVRMMRLDQDAIVSSLAIVDREEEDRRNGHFIRRNSCF